MSSPPPAPISHEPPWPNQRYAWYVVSVLFICSIFSFLDRQILSLVVVEIRRDLGLSEVQIGLLQGPPFAVFYAVMSVPIALAADALNRRNIIAIGVAFWSLATAACGLGGNFIQLFIARIGVGVGEATLSPSAYSLISDYFKKDKLALAMSVLTMGNLTGVGFAMIFGAAVLTAVEGMPTIDVPIVGELFPWQLAFFAVGLPGLALAALVMTIREPVRRGQSTVGSAYADGIGKALTDFFIFAKKHRVTFSTLFASFTLLVLQAYANFGWVPTFFRRAHGLSVGEVSLVYGLIVAVFGTAGALFGGWYSSFLASRGYTDAPYRATLICTLPLAPFAFLTFVVADSWEWAAAFFIPWQFFGSVPAGLAAAAMMMITPNEMRAKIGSIYLFFSSLVGVSLGTVLVAALTQYVFQDDMKIGYSLAVMNCVAAPLAVLMIWPGMRYFRASLKELEESTPA